MYDASDDMMRAKLQDIVAIAGDRPYLVRADEFVLVHTLEQDLSKMER